MQLPNNHIDELIKWHEFTSVCRQIEPWINIGNPYSVRHWAPHKSSTVVLGDFKNCTVLFFIFSFFTKKLKKDFNDDITRAIDVVPMP